jgi:hypothetical protein
MSSQEACDKVKNQVAAMGGGGGDGSDGPGISEKDVCRICDSMAIEAVNKLGSRDNVTVEICFFTGINGYSARSDAVLDEDVEIYRSNSSGGGGAKEVGENGAKYSGGGGGSRDYLSSMVASMSSPAKSGGSSSSSSNHNNNSSSYADESKHSSCNNADDDDDLMDFLADDSNF